MLIYIVIKYEIGLWVYIVAKFDTDCQYLHMLECKQSQIWQILLFKSR